MSPESFNKIPASTNTAEGSSEQMPTDYFERSIFKLNRDINEAEKEKEILLEMSGQFTGKSSLTPEQLAEFAGRFGDLRRFQTNSIDPERFVNILVQDAQTAGEQNSPFGAQIDALTQYQIEWHDELTDVQRQQAEDRAS